MEYASRYSRCASLKFLSLYAKIKSGKILSVLRNGNTSDFVLTDLLKILETETKRFFAKLIFRLLSNNSFATNIPTELIKAIAAPAMVAINWGVTNTTLSVIA